MSQPSYELLLAGLYRAGVPVRELGAGGKIAVAQAAGRIVGAAFAPDAENLFWSNPTLTGDKVVAASDELIGGLGGDRLWFSPELDYNWDGTPNWQTLENYRVPAQIDPGSYLFLEEGPQVVSLHGAGAIPVHGQARRVEFEVQRRIRLAPPPVRSEVLERGAIDYLGIETSHRLEIPQTTSTGRLGLWHLLQVPVDSILVVPTKETDLRSVMPQSYALPGNWQVHADHVSWHFKGVAKGKLGMSAAMLTGRSAVFRRFDVDRWCMIIRDFPLDPGGCYIDHPYGVPLSDQAFQAWDGLGFGEMEFHSPGLDAERGRRAYEESDRLWAFAGAPASITALARQLLAVNVEYILK